MQLAQWIRGSCTEAIQHLLQARPEAETYGVGRQFAHSEEGWRKLIRGAWINGLVERRMIHGAGVGLSKTTAMNTVHPVLCSEEFLSNPQPVLLPALAENSKKPSSQASSNTTKAVVKRIGRGCRAKPIINGMISNPEQWFEIRSSYDYQFPGVFHSEYPQRLGYCPDITKLGLYTASNPEFMYYDIQFGKGKPRNPQKMLVTFTNTGDSLEVMYRITPCAGVKLCSETGCSYVTSTRDCKPCTQHPKAQLQRSGSCPVEFVYIQPCEPSDNRRWLTGIVRDHGEVMKKDNIHNHPIHLPTKIPCRIKNDISEAVRENPHLTTTNLCEGAL